MSGLCTPVLVNFFMSRKNPFLLVLIVLLALSQLCASQPTDQSSPIKPLSSDSLVENQILYNGIAWRNFYTNVKGDQFLFSKTYLPGTVTINKTQFKNLYINYDIYKDEIIAHKSNGTIIQLNKEMVDSFTLVYQYKIYHFKNTGEDSLPGLKGYANVLYHGKSALLVKYRKEIELLAVDDKFDRFFQTHKIYLVSNGLVYQLTGKSDLLKDLEKNKTQIKAYMKKNGLKVSKKTPESFIPVIRYYDSISQ
jgi:hypothetical protein